VDYVAMDLKAAPGRSPGALGPPRELDGIPESIGILKRSGIPHEFRTTAAAPFVDDDAMEEIAKAAAGGRPLHLQALDMSRGVLNPRFMALHPDQPGPKDLERLRGIAARHLPCFIR
jgi:pyruvate formate lyase activating enzyme